MKIKSISLIFGAAVAVSGFATLPTSASVENTVLTEKHATIQHDDSALKVLNIILDKPSDKPSISQEQAVQIAREYSPGYAAEAQSTHVDYKLITNQDFQLFSEAAKEKNSQIAKDGYLNKTPCYIVTFKGITKQARIAQNMSRKVLKEVNIIVDANSGEILYSFSYR